MFAVEEAAEHGAEAAGWFLENAWLIPVIPAVAFFGIIFFGKKLPRGGSELGIGLSTTYSYLDLDGTVFENAQFLSTTLTIHWIPFGD